MSETGFSRAPRVPIAWLIATVAAVALAVTGWIVWASLYEDEATGPEIGITVGDVAESGNDLVGRSVTVSAEIDDVYGPAAFSLVGDPDLLVLTSKKLQREEPLAFGLGERDVVRVSGTVRTLDRRLLEALGIDLSADVVERWRGDPVVVAASVIAAPFPPPSPEED